MVTTRFLRPPESRCSHNQMPCRGGKASSPFRLRTPRSKTSALPTPLPQAPKRIISSHQDSCLASSFRKPPDRPTCHVPRASRPRVMGMVTEAPNMLDLTWAGMSSGLNEWMRAGSGLEMGMEAESLDTNRAGSAFPLPTPCTTDTP